MEAEAVRASSHVSVKRWLPEAAKCLVSVCCASDCTLQEAFISQIAHKAAKPSNCDSTSNGENVGSSLPDHGVGFLYDNSMFFHKRTQGDSSNTAVILILAAAVTDFPVAQSQKGAKLQI